MARGATAGPVTRALEADRSNGQASGSHPTTIFSAYGQPASDVALLRERTRQSSVSCAPHRWSRAGHNTDPLAMLIFTLRREQGRLDEFVRLCR